MNILLIKITSMGDLIQMLPALTDAAKAIPGLQLDWVAEESFVEIPKLHPAVRQIIPLPYRRWKKNIKQPITSGEVTHFLKTLRHQSYDMVIDAQSNLKSAFVTRLARGIKYGLDKKSVAEFGAQWAYRKKISISRDQNHAERMRQLMAMFLNYPMPTEIADYGINTHLLPNVDFPLPERFIFITAISSSKDRLWPEPYWQEVMQSILQAGYEVVLPSWSLEEQARVQRLKNNDPRVHLLPSLTLMEKAWVLSQAKGAISLDTGLSHMAAAVNVPNISLYGPTNAKLTGAVGKQQIHISATAPPCSPCLRTNCHYKGPARYTTACLESITPKQVWDAFRRLFE